MEPKQRERRTNILLGESHTSLFNRFVAKTIDMLVVMAVFFLGNAIFSPLGIIAAAILAAFQDGLGTGQSVGKKIIGLKVLEDATGMACTFHDSFVRNLPFTLAVIFAAIPVLWFLLLIFCIPVLVLEIYLLLSLDSGTRLGDVLGNTLVVEQVDVPLETME